MTNFDSTGREKIEPTSLLLSARRSRCVSYMVSGWIEQVHLGEKQGGTTCYTIGCPDDFYAVRLGFPNIGAEPWRLDKVVGRASSSFNDYVHPTGDGPWVQFAKADQADTTDFIRDISGAPAEILVGADARAARRPAGSPAWTWTHWAPICSNGSDRMSGMRVLMLRGLVPSGQTISYAVGQMRSLLGNRAINSGFDCFIGGLKFDIDRVNTKDDGEATLTWIDNQLAVGSIFPMVQFLTKNAGVTTLLVGDSHQQGTSTTEQFTNFVYRAITSLIPELGANVPLGYVNAAQGGLTSETFFDRMQELLPVIRPSFAILPGWTYNDEHDGIHANRKAMNGFLARLLAAVELCNSQSVTPILTTPFPRDVERMKSAQIEPWHWLRQQILSMGSTNVQVIDASELFGRQCNGILDGTYLAHYSSDSSHPDDAGHEALSQSFRRKILWAS